jgi:hypothetical protein
MIKKKKMNNGFKKLTNNEWNELLKAPVLLSIYAASGDHDISKREKAEAIKMAHFKTFTENPFLVPYYKEVDKRFTKYFEEVVEKYAPFDDLKREKLKEEISMLDPIVGKLNKEFAKTFTKSLRGYSEHVKKAGRGYVIDFVFPLPLPGITG